MVSDIVFSRIYKKYGYDIRTIASLSEEEIIKVNEIISIEENRRYSEPKRKNVFRIRSGPVITSGSGFVDKLMLLSIVATELMIGLVILSVLGR